MGDLPDLAGLLQAAGGLHQRLTSILEWALDALKIDGIALFVDTSGHAESLDTRVSLGSLATTAPLLAAELSRTGIPSHQGILPLPSTARDGAFLCCPVNVDGGGPWSALVLHGPRIEETARANNDVLQEVVTRLRDALQDERAQRSGPRRPAEPAAALLPSLSLLTEGLRLPLYVCDLQGRFGFASPAFLQLTGYASAKALAQSRDLFREPEKRAEELEIARRQGRVESFDLKVTTGSGGLLHVRDSAVSVGDLFLGVFVDVTSLVAANAELNDALQVQELLNNNIIAGASQLRRTQDAAVRSLARLAEFRDPETGFHLQRICEYTHLVAMEVHLRAPYSFRITREYANDISISCMLHDIGKVSIPDHILLKPGKLDPQEWEIMKKHTIFGWEVLHRADRELGEQSFLTLAASIARSHHERYDGKGYPDGAAGEKIPLSARISAIADVYDALTTARPYKEAWDDERAAAEIIAQSGSQFDPVLVNIFQDLRGRFADVRRRLPG